MLACMCASLSLSKQRKGKGGEKCQFERERESEKEETVFGYLLHVNFAIYPPYCIMTVPINDILRTYAVIHKSTQKRD